MAITGLPLDQAKALLDSHGGNINAAAEAHFSVRSDGTNTVDHARNEGSSTSDSNPEEVVAQLFEGAKARSKNDSFSGSGRALGSSSERDSSESTREIHCAFFSDAVLFFEAATVDNRKGRHRRSGVHTVKSTAGPYGDRRELGWITSDMKEKYRVTTEDPEYKNVVANMRAGNVPKFLTNEGGKQSRTSFGIVLHDHRSSTAPPRLHEPTSSSWGGEGRSLQENGTTMVASKTTEKTVDKMELYSTPAIVLLMATIFPIALSWFNWNVHLGHALFGGVIGYAVVNAGLPSMLLGRREFLFVLDMNKPTITVKVRFGRKPLWEEKFNSDVHSLDTLFRVLSKKVLDEKSYEEETLLRNTGSSDSLMKISYGFPRKTLTPDAQTSLREAKLDKEIILVELRR